MVEWSRQQKIGCSVAVLLIATCGAVAYSRLPRVGDHLPIDPGVVVVLIRTYIFDFKRYPPSFEYCVALSRAKAPGYRKIGDCLYSTPWHGLMFTYYLDRSTGLPVLILHEDETNLPDSNSMPSKRVGWKVPLELLEPAKVGEEPK